MKKKSEFKIEGGEIVLADGSEPTYQQLVVFTERLTYKQKK